MKRALGPWPFGDADNKVADDTEPRHYGSPCVIIKQGSVPDKLRVLSTDES